MRKVPPPLLRKLNAKHQTPYNNAEPRMNIALARARSSIMDATYFTIETIRTKAGIGDISIAIKRTVPYGSPSAIYDIHLDNGVAKTAIRYYPDRKREGWQEQFEIGPSIAVAIAFDGRWERNNKRKWQMTTHDKPYIFYVRPNGQLYTRIWDNGNEMLLSGNVKKIKAIRGWKSQVIGIDDHGLIAAYIKNDGKVYYRNLCEQENGSVVWEPEREVTRFTGTAINLNLFITNDYRTAIIIENNQGKVNWFITPRNWAGMAIAADKILVKPNIQTKFTKTRKRRMFNEEKIVTKVNTTFIMLYASSFNKFTEIKNIDDGKGNFGRIVNFKTAFELYNLNALDFVLIDNRGVRYNSESVSKITDKEYQLKFLNFNNAWGNVTLKCLSLHTKNEAGFIFEEFENEFIPNNLNPVEVPPSKVAYVYNKDDKSILLEFDRELVGRVNNSLSAFTVTSVAWKDTFEDVMISESHQILDVEKISDKVIQININPLTRLRRANKVVVNYDSTKGFLFGESSPVESFSKWFIPDISIINDPAKREKIKVNHNVNISFKKINHIETYQEEVIKVTPVIQATLIKVDDINP